MGLGRSSYEKKLEKSLLLELNGLLPINTKPLRLVIENWRVWESLLSKVSSLSTFCNQISLCPIVCLSFMLTRTDMVPNFQRQVTQRAFSTYRKWIKQQVHSKHRFTEWPKLKRHSPLTHPPNKSYTISLNSITLNDFIMTKSGRFNYVNFTNNSQTFWPREKLRDSDPKTRTSPPPHRSV